MLHNLIKLKSILDETPKMRKADLLQGSGITAQELSFLVENNIVKEKGKTKGTVRTWVGNKPDYVMVQSLVGSDSLANAPSLLDVIVSKHEVTVRVSPDVTLRVLNDNKVTLTKGDGSSVVFSDPMRLKEVLSLIS